MKSLMIILPLAVLAFCIFGFLATLEPIDEGSQLTWRLIYGAGGILSLTLMVVSLARTRRREDPE